MILEAMSVGIVAVAFVANAVDMIRLARRGRPSPVFPMHGRWRWLLWTWCAFLIAWVVVGMGGQLGLIPEFDRTLWEPVGSALLTLLCAGGIWHRHRLASGGKGAEPTVR